MALPMDMDKALPAPTGPQMADPEDSVPWSAADDNRLRKFAAPFANVPNPPWPVIAMRCNFGHNSGSCAKRWLELTRTESKWEAGRRFEFKGANGGGEVIGYKGQFSTPYIPA